MKLGELVYTRLFDKILDTYNSTEKLVEISLAYINDLSLNTTKAVQFVLEQIITVMFEKSLKEKGINIDSCLEIILKEFASKNKIMQRVTEMFIHQIFLYKPEVISQESVYKLLFEKIS